LKVLLLIAPFIAAFFLARFVGFWRALLASLATLITIFLLLFLFTSTNEIAMIVGATLMVSTILGPIYIVGLVTGHFFRRPSASKETKASPNTHGQVQSRDIAQIIWPNPRLQATRMKPRAPEPER
jgi:archaellum biogenesis protein FlaJ (TadC family)